MNALLHPSALLLLTLPLLGALFFLSRRKKGNNKKVFFSLPPVLMRKLHRSSVLPFRVLFFITLLSFGLLAFAIGRPHIPHADIKKWTESIDIMIVFDVSESMDADDLTPSRINAAKQVVRDFIRKREEDRIGLVLFSGDAVTKCPLTTDKDFLLGQVNDIKLREMKQGTAIGMGLSSGISRLRKSTAKNKIIILLTDGDSNVGAINPITAAHLAKQEKIKIYTIGIGKADRVVIPIYAYDPFGNKTQIIAQVPSYLNPELLQKISSLTGGKSYMARDSLALSQMLMEIDSLEKTKITLLKRIEIEEKYQNPALLAAILIFSLFVLEETRYQRKREVG